MLIRAMRVQDIDVILRIETASHALPWTYNNFYTSLTSHYPCWCIDDIHQFPKAYCVLMPTVDDLHILNLTVSSTYRRQGYASCLLDAACQFALQEGIPNLLLEVRPSNEAAFSLYQRYGFVQIGRRRGYYVQPNGLCEDALVMQYRLNH